ncbi:hypothetical protein J5N97_024525 [Dioscorea zingiberensis]|uniref:NAC domain-containing protein n=1 Tax=Dioscorea zingiberensis TaxID=325984 RepID=A0A9D5H951_9LILI|nr:hypothetical protein J5N97_024525 [Dioscorea zingiberensis]
MAKRSNPGCTKLLRQAGNGYWHMNGTTKKVYDSSNNVLAGTTSALTYMATTEGGKKKKKTKWVMHEYRLDPSYFDKQTMELVVCSLQESGRGGATQSSNENHRHQPLMLAAPETLPQKRPREDYIIEDETEHGCKDEVCRVNGVLLKRREGLLEDVVGLENDNCFGSSAAAGLESSLSRGTELGERSGTGTDIIGEKGSTEPPRPELEFSGQDIDSLLNNINVVDDHEPSQNINVWMGLAIPMDDLSDINMII